MPGGRPKGIPKTGGRVKGTPNKNKLDIGAFARSVIEDHKFQFNFIRQAQNGHLQPQLITMLFHYGYGKPIDQRNMDEDIFMERLTALVLKHVESGAARAEIRQFIEAYTGTETLKAVA